MIVRSLKRPIFTARAILQRLQCRNAKRGAVLMYHRIASPASDPWRTAVSPKNFQAHMDVIKSRNEARSLSDFSRHLVSEGKPDNSIIVTFDDGYADNLSSALPILEKRNIPATVFVASGLVGVKDGFWWDALNRIFLETQVLPEVLELKTKAGTATWRLDDSARYSKYDLDRSACWSADEEPPRSRRENVFLEVWVFLLALTQEERRDALAQLITWAGLSYFPEEGDKPRPMNQTELRLLAASPLIEIGGHTLSHPDLSALSKSSAEAEIRDDRASLIQMSGQSVETFAYPFGRFATETAGQVAKAGYICAGCSRAGIATVANDSFLLPRIEVPNISGPEFKRLINHLLGPALPSPGQDASKFNALSEPAN